MQQNFWRLALCLMVSAGAVLIAGVAKASEPGKYGKTLLATVVLDDKDVQRFRDHKPSLRDAHEAPVVAALMADSEDWTGKLEPWVVRNNPHTLVVKLTGRALNDGAASSMWLSGWHLEADENGQEQSTMQPLAGLTELKGKAGQPFRIEATSGPVTFSRDRMAAPALSFVNSSNMQIDKVEVEVWGGMAETPTHKLFLSAPWLWMGGILLLVFWWWRRN
ncbi:hypothetical protein [Uliginosibacterium sp. H1]|uniref:hypothetical protein n=1 Tax=Uliginosibacterium sp. H1 TaxID=3114757 RepID=UPI002E1796D5|nr:hypothetical protein [Uliginosibacterium sp. H1]